MKAYHHSFAYLLFLFCLNAVVSFAQSPSPTLAAALAAQSYRAFSGGKPVASVSMNGTANWHYGSDEQSGTVQLTASVDGSSRMELRLDRGRRLEAQSAFTTTPVCTWTSFDGVQHDFALHNCLTSAVWFLPQITLQRSLSPPSLAEVGSENHLWQARAPKLKVSNSLAEIEKISASDLEFDTTTALPIALFFNIHSDDDAGTDIPVEIRYSDYRQLEGVTVPFKIEKYVNHTLVLEIEIKSATATFGTLAAS